MKIQVDALDVTITISIPDSARQLALGDGRLQIIATLDEPVSLGVPAVDVTGVNAVLRERGELWVLDDGYLDAEKRQLPAPLRGAREARITVDGLEVRLPSSEVWGSSARSPHHDFIIERRSGGGWKIAPSPRSFEAIDAHLKKLVRGVDLRGLEVDRQHLAGPGLPLNPNKLEWQVAVTGMAAIEARDREDLPFPVRRLHVVVENGRATLTGDTVEPIDEARALKFERKRSDGPFGPVWPEHSEPLTPVLPSTSDADPRSSAEHSHLWLRSERGWVNVGCSEADEPSWPTTAARSGLLVALHPWFPSRPGLRIHALLDRAQTWFRLDDDGRATVKLSGLPIQVELDGCALFEPADHKAPELPPAPGRAPTTLVLVSDAWLTPSSKPPPQRFELRHDRGDWTLIAESGGCIDWRPWSKPPLLGDARWAANDPDLGVRCSGNRVLI
ncbi:MAG TPA: hypothetical protein VK034_12290, partial [Enhygromyxa sp.]|nr:hypothetical protein [Enhygromyxa sp.]